MTSRLHASHDIASAWTPGPWRVSLSGCATYTIENLASRIRSDSVANPNWDGGRPSVPLGQVEANAHLIAAAPDLYEAVAEAMLAFTHYAELHQAKGNAEGNLKAGRNRKLAEKMKAALAKARGEQVRP